MMDVLTYEQNLLTRYLAELKIPLAKIMYIVAILSEDEATREMLAYIVETRETNSTKLTQKAEEISQKYKSDIE